MKIYYFGVVLVFIHLIGLSLLFLEQENKSYIKESSIVTSSYLTTYNPLYTSLEGEINPSSVQCPIPLVDRVVNYTGTQCVWSSIEMLGRWAEEPKLINPTLTSRKLCQSYSDPYLTNIVLNSLNVKYDQIYSDRVKGLELIRKAMREGRGCLFSIPGHAMVLVHFDEVNGIVKYVDNSDITLKIQTMSISRFYRVWDSWVLVIYADKDVVTDKVTRMRRDMYNIPIIDRNDPSQRYPRDYILLP